MRFLVTGASGQLGVELVKALGERDVRALSHSELDVTDYHAVMQEVLDYMPDVIVHAAAYTDVDGAESAPEAAFAVNGWGSRNVALAAKASGAYLCYVSSDYVFDGSKDSYCEWDDPAPIGVYGRSKLAGEREVASHAPSWMIVRTAWLCGRVGRNFVRTILSLRDTRDTIPVVNDQRGSPSLASDVAEAIVRLCLARMEGIFHVTNSGAATWFEVARAVMEAAGDEPGRIVPVSTEEFPRPARRPRSSVLENRCLAAAGLPLLRPWRKAFEELVADLTESPQAGA